MKMLKGCCVIILNNSENTRLDYTVVGMCSWFEGAKLCIKFPLGIVWNCTV